MGEALAPRRLRLRGRRFLQLPAPHLWHRNISKLRGLAEALPLQLRCRRRCPHRPPHDLRGCGVLVGLDDLHQFSANDPNAGLQHLLHTEGARLGPIEAADVAVLVQPHLRGPGDLFGWHTHRKDQGSPAKPVEHPDGAGRVPAEVHALLPQLHAHAVGHTCVEPYPLHPAHQVLYLEEHCGPRACCGTDRARGPRLLRHWLPLSHLDDPSRDCHRVLHPLPRHNRRHFRQLLHRPGGVRLPHGLCRDPEARSWGPLLRNAALARTVRPLGLCGSNDRRHLGQVRE
mmetsp:Transcript_41524/g.115461  ORF Transcript_41524/g.115461 Transcript_41524/m.115461 type:complete len:286 (-) Transcript_41524:851-1708(-)